MTSERIQVPSRIGWVYLSKLEVDEATQRPLRPGWVKARAPHFDPEALGLICVSKRDGKELIVDGHHRVHLLRTIGYGDQQVQAEVYEGLTKEQEAQLFLERNDRQALSPVQRFLKEVTAGHADALAMNRVVQGLGLKIGDNKGGAPAPGRGRLIHAIEAVRFVYKGAGVGQGGPAALKATLATLRAAWGEDSSVWRGQLIKGMGIFCVRNAGTIKVEDLIKRLEGFHGGASGFYGKAQGRHEYEPGNLPQVIAKIIAETYNKGRRTQKAA